MLKILFTSLLLFGAVQASACFYDTDKDGKSGYVYGNGWLLTCTKTGAAGGMEIFSCKDQDNEKLPLIIEKATQQGVLNGEKCEKGTGLPDMCMITRAC
jgi:hypothetical protein